MMTNPISRLSANNAAFNMMNAADSLSCSPNGKAITRDMQNDSLIYKANSLMADSQERATDANIKRTFSVFA